MIAPSGMVSTLANGFLFRWNEKHEPIPELVDTYTVAKDGLTITMTLKPNLKYSDGSPLTIDDVLYNWDRMYKSPITEQGLTKDVASLTALTSQRSSGSSQRRVPISSSTRAHLPPDPPQEADRVRPQVL